MKLEKELGSFSRYITHRYISFRTGHGGVTNAPDQIRDGKTGLVKSVARTSQGLFTVTMRTDAPSPTRFAVELVSLANPSSSAPTQAARALYVAGSYSQSAGTFQVVVVDCNNTTPAVVDPDADSRISVHLVGSISSVGTDAA